jgi:hypothetical protein
MLPVSLDCPLLIAPMVFSNVYLSCVFYFTSFSGFSFVDQRTIQRNWYIGYTR